MHQVRSARAVVLAVLALAAGGALLGTSFAAATTSRKHRHRVCVVPGVGKPLDQIWHPHYWDAWGYARGRIGDIAFAVRTDKNFWAYRPDHVEWSASVVKAMLLVAYLNEPWVANRSLDSSERATLGAMITQSDNNAAQQIFDTVGQGALQALAARVGMTNFATDPVWGKTRITARDQTKYFLHIDSYVVHLHQYYAMHLLESITPSQRWGIGEVAPKGWTLYFKGGWGYGTGLLDHQVALLTRGCARFSVAVLTMYDGNPMSHEYGKETLRGIFERLLRGLPTGARKRHRHKPHGRA